MEILLYLLLLAVVALIILYVNRWENFDPEWLALLAEDQYPEEKSLHRAIRKCTKVKGNHFVAPKNPNQPGSEWRFEKSVTLVHPEMDDIILDILKDGRVGSIEYLGLMCKK